MKVEVKKVVDLGFEKLAWVLVRMGFLPEGDGRPEGWWGEEQFGDCRDCDSLEEEETYKRIFGSRLKTK